jgi:hypothetical protein
MAKNPLDDAESLDAVETIEAMAESGAKLSLSVTRMLLAAIKALGGPEGLGIEAARIIKDGDAPVASRVTLINNLMKMSADHGGDEQDSGGLMTEDMIRRQLEELSV